MIGNIITLLVTNIVMPYLPHFPIPTQVLMGIPIPLILRSQSSLFSTMNISRLHSKQQFKKSFRQALKNLHPDRGGNQDTFSYVKNLKVVMQTNPRYYDSLNITSLDSSFSQPLEYIAASKQISYFVSSAIFYFVILLYSITFTIDDNLKPSRKYIIPLIIVFALYQYFIHTYSEYRTIIDIIYDRIPIFIQQDILKKTLSIWIAVIRTHYIKKETEQKKILNEMSKQSLPQTTYKQLLIRLNTLYTAQILKKSKDDTSLFTKIRGWMSKIITIIILISVFSGFFTSSPTQDRFQL